MNAGLRQARRARDASPEFLPPEINSAFPNPF
jgi:hypothetical protein